MGDEEERKILEMRGIFEWEVKCTANSIITLGRHGGC